jgi:hypothetical protein
MSLLQVSVPLQYPWAWRTNLLKAGWRCAAELFQTVKVSGAVFGMGLALGRHELRRKKALNLISYSS